MDDGIVYSHADMVYGFDVFIDPFAIHESGMYRATVADHHFPAGNEFDYLGIMVTQGSVDQMGMVEGPGYFDFYADEGMYNLFFVGSVAGAGGDSPLAGIGSYGVQVAMVPELETWLMFGVGLLGMTYWLRVKRKREDANDSFQAGNLTLA